MDEHQWLHGTDADAMVDHLREVMTQRKLLLYASAVCRQLWPRLTDPRSRRVVEIAERYVDGRATLPELETARDEARQVQAGLPGAAATLLAQMRWRIMEAYARIVARVAVADQLQESDPDTPWEVVRQAGLTLRADILRELFGNPFRPVTVDPLWRSRNVLSLAQTIYDRFDSTPSADGDHGALILADALMDEGCEDEQILSHLRSNIPHHKGCWVIDSVLEK